MITFALAAMCCLGAQAQEKLFNSASVQSPVINKDGTVTFNLFAPKAVACRGQERCLELHHR